MKKRIVDFIWGVYTLMQRNYVTFRFLMWLKECGIMRNISYLVGRFKNPSGRPAEVTQESRKFFSANADRVKSVL